MANDKIIIARLPNEYNLIPDQQSFADLVLEHYDPTPGDNHLSVADKAAVTTILTSIDEGAYGYDREMIQPDGAVDFDEISTHLATLAVDMRAHKQITKSPEITAFRDRLLKAVYLAWLNQDPYALPERK